MISKRDVIWLAIGILALSSSYLIAISKLDHANQDLAKCLDSQIKAEAKAPEVKK